MDQSLTKPQADLLLKALRADTALFVSRQRWRTAGNLRKKGFLSEGDQNAFYLTRAGLVELADYWMRKDAAGGCIAYQETRSEVESALSLMKALA